MSGAPYSRIESDVLRRMQPPADAHMYVFSDSSAQCHAWNGSEWTCAYNFPLTADERKNIHSTILTSVAESRIMADHADESRILDRETSIAFTALRHGATQAEKLAWDPTGTKRARLLALLRARLPEYETSIGGKTTIDVTKKGINKAYGVTWFAEKVYVPTSALLFVGDAFYAGGNDAIVIPTGVQTHATSGPDETDMLIDELIRKAIN